MDIMRTLLSATHRDTAAAKAAEKAGDDADKTDVHAHYAADWLDTGGVRVNFIASVDGRVTVSGLSRGLQTPGDNTVFAALRDLADVIVVGAATAAHEGYQPAKPSAERRAIRSSHGLAPVPAIAVMSSSLDLDLDSELYSAAHRDAPTLIITGSAAPMSRRNDIIDLASSTPGIQLLEAPSNAGGGVELGAAVTALRELGYRRILCEGGPRLFSSAMLARAVDELCLTVSPMMVGPGGPRLSEGPAWPQDFIPQLTLTGLLIEDDALFCRYRVQH
jgi:riboflavin biosynthesis pyrimidine reductase